MRTEKIASAPHPGCEGGDAQTPVTSVETTSNAPPVVAAACAFVLARKRPAVFYLLGEGDDAEHRPDVPITKKTVEQLASALNDDGPFHDLDLVIQSSGGDIHAAYQIMTLLRQHMTADGELVACVPRRAASAALLLCLGADRILLGETGSLSPLDAQIKMGVTSAGTPAYTSALHLLKGLDRLRQFSLETFDRFAERLYAQNPERSEEALLHYSIEFSRAITAPLLERIDSSNVGYWDQMLHTGEVYARQLLGMSNLVPALDDEEKQRKIGDVVHDLVNKYPSHTMIIDSPQLADELGLRAEILDKDLRAEARKFSACSSETVIMIVYPPTASTEAPSDAAHQLSLEEWHGIGADSQARDVIESFDGSTFRMRVGLYRPKITSSNPWQDGQGVARTDGPSSAWYASGWFGGLPGAPTRSRPPWLRRRAQPDEPKQPPASTRR